LIFGFGLILFHPVRGQEVTGERLELPELSVEQKVDRAVMNAISYMMMGISYAKSLGETAFSFGAHSAGMAVPFYEELRGQSPMAVIEALNNVQQTDRRFQIEVYSSTDTSLQARMTLYGIQYIRLSDGFGGVLVDDCFSYYNAFLETFTGSLGYRYTYEVEGDWIRFSITKV